MAAVDIKVPSVGESVTEAVLAQWFKQDGERVRKDEPLFVLETDKVTLEVTAPDAGVLRILAPAGSTVRIGAVVATIETAAAAAASPAPEPHRAPEPRPPAVTAPPASASAPAPPQAAPSQVALATP